MIKSAIAYSFALAVFAFFLDWLEYRYMMRAFSTEAFVVVVALVFTAFGAWTAWRLLPSEKTQLSTDLDHKRTPDKKLKPTSKPNSPVLQTRAGLKLTERENEVLQLLAQGMTNKEMARKLGLAPDTVKSHLSNIYRKLNVNRRTQAIGYARHINLTS